MCVHHADGRSVGRVGGTKLEMWSESWEVSVGSVAFSRRNNDTGLVRKRSVTLERPWNSCVFHQKRGLETRGAGWASACGGLAPLAVRSESCLPIRGGLLEFQTYAVCEDRGMTGFSPGLSSNSRWAGTPVSL